MTAPSTVKAMFAGSGGDQLAARLDLPAGTVRAFALFAHCFTCGKDVLAARRIAAGLAEAGVGVLRFDFTGLGSSDGEFANTHFSSNIEDLVHAADYLRQAYQAPALLIGHSLGGAAVLAAAARIPEAKAVVVIGAPADAAHVLRHLGGALDDIRAKGHAEVSLAGRSFTIKSSFVEDAESHKLAASIRGLGKALLVMHAPLDDVVDVANAAQIFLAAKHPKSFVSLDGADHLLSHPGDAAYAARVIAAWASKYIAAPSLAASDHDHVLVHETGVGKFQNIAMAGRHVLLADEPESAGGQDTGPSPYDLLAIALGACTAMTLRIYAEHKTLALGRLSVEVSHGKVPSEHCTDCGHVAAGRQGKIDRFERIIRVDGAVDEALGAKIVEIAGKCPVHRTLETASAIVTRLERGAGA